ncbi:hypothetical protein NOK12_36730 [Nocardioides sp. OK12]|uniref:ABC transporter substrate-binding protein n=1 Tax=Nocardioides sp. OK12 TaxID=2758661 RepID=UPI0021C42B7F|nr:ABC transporter substrate-binding protein [Nocardioides sp. OK12]GHJ61155.1 hypothetical protein NOK12_36730 [Nocardioides sp. OK12]
MRRRLTGPLPALAAGTALLLGACSGGGDEPGPGSAEATGSAAGSAGVPASVALPTADGVGDGDPLRVGVLLTLRSEPGQGQDVVAAAEGATVAAYRLRLGGGDVELEVVDDGGTAAGAEAAVEQLVASDVAGIVAATRGDHLDEALEAATSAGTAVLLPYERGADLPVGAFATGPDAASVDRVLLEVMQADGLSRPFVLTADDVELDVGSADAAGVGADLDATVERVAEAYDAGRVDSVLVAAAASTQARVVAALQGAAPAAPVVLSPEALSPAFAAGLAEASGTTAGAYLTAGTDAGDATTLSQGARAEGVSAFFAALRLAAGDPGITDLFGDAAFAQVAADADTASHDAVVALAAAAQAAGSVEPGDVLSALSGLQVGPDDGLAGPALDFGSDRALPPASVVALRATGQDPGVRPAVDAAGGGGSGGSAGGRLFWFADDTTG